MQRLYGKPSDGEINDYVSELVELLLAGCLESVEYGFKNSGKWAVALSYTVYANGLLSADNSSGRVPIGADITRATWGSFLRKNAKFSSMSSVEKQRLLDSIPVKRSDADAPEAGNGVWVTDKAYSSSGVAMQRRIFKPL